MSEERKSFQYLPAFENPSFASNGYIIYKTLKEKYPDASVVDLDNILNSLCAALCFLVRDHVEKDDYPYILQVIHKALKDNLQ